MNNQLDLILNKFRENKMAHAYLIETNNQDECLKDLLEIIKYINCPSNYKEQCNECNLCNLINRNNLPTLNIIEPDGNNIKKIQIQDLKDNFSTKPVYSKFNIYIIKNAEKLNDSSANTMLKFLEEPDGQVLGFFITNNKDNLILTIQSRCQNIKAMYKITNKAVIFKANDNDQKEIIFILKNYLKGIESKNKLIILNNKNEIIANVLTKIKLDEMFKYLLEIYKNALYYKRGIVSFEEYTDFSFILDNSEEKLLSKINLLMWYIDKFNYNLNTELFLDRFVIEMSGIND